MLLGNNHLGNNFNEDITIKTLFASAIANSQGGSRGLKDYPYLCKKHLELPSSMFYPKSQPPYKQGDHTKKLHMNSILK